MKKLLLFGTMLVAFICMSCNGSSSRGDHRKYVLVEVEGKDGWSVMDSNGDLLEGVTISKDRSVSEIYDDVLWIDNERERFHLYSLSSLDKPLSEDEWYIVTHFAAGRALARREGSKEFNIIDVKGNIVKTLSEDFTYVEQFTEDGVAYFEKGKDRDRLKGLIDVNGDVILEGHYRNLFPPSDNAVIFTNEELTMMEVCDLKGNLLFEIDPLEYHARTFGDMHVGFTEGLLPLPLHDAPTTWAFVDKSGKRQFTLENIGRPRYSGYKDGYAVLTDGSTLKDCSIIDKKGNITFSTKGEFRLTNIGNGYFITEGHGGYYSNDQEIIIDAKGNEVCSLAGYRVAGYNETLGENIILLKQDGHYGLVDMKGQQVNKTPIVRTTKNWNFRGVQERLP